MGDLAGQIFDFEMKNGTVIELLQKANQFTDVGYGGSFGIFTLIMIAGPLFLMMKVFGTEKAIPVTMLITSILGLFLRLLGLINDFALWVCIALLIGGIIMMMQNSNQF